MWLPYKLRSQNAFSSWQTEMFSGFESFTFHYLLSYFPHCFSHIASLTVETEKKSNAKMQLFVSR